MDTDGERDHECFFVVIVRYRAQCHRAYAYLVPYEESGESIHKSVYANVTNQFFICWQDLKLEVLLPVCLTLPAGPETGHWAIWTGPAG